VGGRGRGVGEGGAVSRRIYKLNISSHGEKRSPRGRGGTKGLTLEERGFGGAERGRVSTLIKKTT